MANATNNLGNAIALALGTGVMMETKVADKVFQIDPTTLPDNAILDLLRYGTQRRFNDATGGSDKTAEDKHKTVAEMIERYQSGVIRATRAASGGADEATKVARKLIREALKAKLTKEQYKEAITDADAKDRDQLLDTVYANNEAKFKPQVDAELKRMAAEREAKAKLAGGLDLGGIDL